MFGRWASLVFLILVQTATAAPKTISDADAFLLAEGLQPHLFYVTQPDNADPVTVAKTWLRLEAAYATLDIKLVAIRVPLARVYLMAEQGSADGAMAGFAETVEPQYPNLIRVKTPIFRSRYDIYGYGEPGSIESWDDIGTARVAAIRGFETAAKHLTKSQIVWVNTAEQLVDMVEQKRVSYFVGLEQQSKAILAQRHANALAGKDSGLDPDESSMIHRLSKTPVHVVTLNHYLSPQHANLSERLGKALAAQHLAAD